MKFQRIPLVKAIVLVGSLLFHVSAQVSFSMESSSNGRKVSRHGHLNAGESEYLKMESGNGGPLKMTQSENSQYYIDGETYDSKDDYDKWVDRAYRDDEDYYSGGKDDGHRRKPLQQSERFRSDKADSGKAQVPSAKEASAMPKNYAKDHHFIPMMQYDQQGNLLSNGANDSDKQAQDGANIFMGVLIMLTGLVFLFFGRRMFKPALFLAGFYVFAGLMYVILVHMETFKKDGQSNWGSSRTTIYICSSIAAGIVGGFILSAFWKLGLFAMGGLGGFTVAIYIMSWSSKTLIQNDSGRTVLIVFLCVIGGITAMFFENHLIIISTSFAGAYGLMYGVDTFLNSGFRNAASSILRGHPADYQIHDSRVYTLLGCMLACFAVGLAVQYGWTSRNAEPVSVRRKQEYKVPQRNKYEQI
ncbi:hypothetical protein MIR68_003942 [Amoeboaphelidium protococcarum]|nr:hypothetical protein MIR68_003942 [Amoeboaphelidium protococcarum]